MALHHTAGGSPREKLLNSLTALARSKKLLNALLAHLDKKAADRNKKRLIGCLMELMKTAKSDRALRKMKKFRLLKVTVLAFLNGSGSKPIARRTCLELYEEVSSSIRDTTDELRGRDVFVERASRSFSSAVSKKAKNGVATADLLLLGTLHGDAKEWKDAGMTAERVPGGWIIKNQTLLLFDRSDDLEARIEVAVEKCIRDNASDRLSADFLDSRTFYSEKYKKHCVWMAKASFYALHFRMQWIGLVSNKDANTKLVDTGKQMRLLKEKREAFERTMSRDPVIWAIQSKINKIQAAIESTSFNNTPDQSATQKRSLRADLRAEKRKLNKEREILLAMHRSAS